MNHSARTRAFPALAAAFALHLALGVVGVEANEIDDPSLLLLPEPPHGFVVERLPLLHEGKSLGFIVVLHKPGSGGRVTMQAETNFDRTTRPARVAATKGYVNGVAEGLHKQGFKIAEKQIPDIEKADFSQPVVVSITYANDAGEKIYSRQRLFFTQHGYNVNVLTSDPEELELLSEWASRVRPYRAPN
ncbi:hypothetical protein Mal64_08190 [Pseudobythopirellula maris]|uniref:Uncharacterized protein n=1 Tax=Pseudobythopirellula maris TaxID=2527991 RepID=A0A5C5ZT57_9BACT|nr:hypothetical protein [Pseudobythopirellula maris]TWT90430.1 hypothetical protein Mal64_08190 [Pseudobythopirellula maris]